MLLQSASQHIEPPARSQTSLKWGMFALLVLALIINYVHRQTIGILKPEIMQEFRLDEKGFAQLVFWFQMAYALGFLGFGKLFDSFTMRIGYGLAFAGFCIAQIACGLATNLSQFILARFMLGLGTASTFPGSIKAIVNGFTPSMRTLMIGILNSGPAVGSIIALFFVPLISVHFGWRFAFILLGGIGLLWLIAYVGLFWAKRQPMSSASIMMEVDKGAGGEKTSHIPWLKLFATKQLWAYSLAKFFTDSVWWFYLFWLPDFLRTQHHLKVSEFAPMLGVVYLISAIGSFGGGVLYTHFIKDGLSINWARKLTFMISALCVMPVLFVDGESNIWLAVVYLGIATAAHQSFSTNLFAMSTDIFPKSAIASVVGIGGFFGVMGGMVFAQLAGEVLQVSQSYYFLFGFASSAYFLAVFVIHLLSPKLSPVTKFDAI